MMRPVVGTALRWVAIAIALLAAYDPTITVSRAGRPLVAVIAADPERDSVATSRVVASLRADATVVAGAFGGADATVIVGESLPADAMESATPVFAVVPPGLQRAAIELVSAPRVATLDAVIPVSATVSGPAGQALDVALFSGEVELDRKAISASTSAQRVSVELHAAPADTGAQSLRLVATIGGVPVASANVTVDVRPRRWNVLFYDARASWSSRFVRMAVERDPRFAVVGRLVTSRAYASDVGSPPANVEDDAVLRGYDAIVVGGPGALSDRAVQGLERYMRLRGGSVVLLMDDAPDETVPVARLSGATGWRTREDAGPARISTDNWRGMMLRASQIAFPAKAPAGMRVIADARAERLVEPRTVSSRSAPTAPGSPIDTTPRAALWATSVGAGNLVVSGALDAWRFRDSTLSNFDRVWQDVIADAAARAPEPISVSVPDAVRPNERLTVRVSLRDVALRAQHSSSARAGVSAVIVSPTGSRTPLRLWPVGSIGDFNAVIRGPAQGGAYHIEVASGGDRASVPFMVSAGASSPSGPARAALVPWIQGNGGRIFTADQLSRLPDAIRGAISFAPRAEPAHPMRSPWWIVPFALLLSFEWWSRRRRGLA